MRGRAGQYAGTDRDEAQQGAFNEILSSAEAKAYFSRLGWQPLYTKPEELAEHIKVEIVRWGKVMQAAGAEGVE